jgi:hypothetical protein
VCHQSACHFCSLQAVERIASRELGATPINGSAVNEDVRGTGAYTARWTLVVHHQISRLIEAEEDLTRCIWAEQPPISSVLVDQVRILNDEMDLFKSASRWPLDEKRILVAKSDDIRVHRLPLLDLPELRF